MQWIVIFTVMHAHSGIGKVSIMDDGVVLAEDLGANFFISESDVGSSSRAEASVGKMRELNPRVAVEVLIGDCDAIDEDRYGTHRHLRERLCPHFNLQAIIPGAHVA